jgi:hypothetical protein
MRKFSLHFAMLLACALAVSAQQPGSTDAQASSSNQASAQGSTAGSMDQAKTPAAEGSHKGKNHPVTGCLSGPNEEGAYVLTSGRHKIEVGGNDELKNHVGHKVTLTGDWASAADIGENEAAAKNEKGEKGERHLKVTSIKMVSESCGKATTSSKPY